LAIPVFRGLFRLLLLLLLLLYNCLLPNFTHFHPEDRGNMYLQNIDTHLLDHNMNIRSDVDSIEKVGDKKI
jgi:hypothetical protein